MENSKSRIVSITNQRWTGYKKPIVEEPNPIKEGPKCAFIDDPK
jgi:hypothetical protein